MTDESRNLMHQHASCNFAKAFGSPRSKAGHPAMHPSSWWPLVFLLVADRFYQSAIGGWQRATKNEGERSTIYMCSLGDTVLLYNTY